MEAPKKKLHTEEANPIPLLNDRDLSTVSFFFSLGFEYGQIFF